MVYNIQYSIKLYIYIYDTEMNVPLKKNQLIENLSQLFINIFILHFI